MIAEQSLSTLTMLVWIFGMSAGLMAIATIGLLIAGGVTLENYEQSKRAKAKWFFLAAPLTAALIVVFGAFSVKANTEYNLRKDVNVPGRVHRVEVDSNAPTGVIVDGR